MRRTFLVFLLTFAFLMPSFSATSSGSLEKPTVFFKSWRIGRSAGNRTDNDLHKSFITSTETTCWIFAEVGYASNQNPANTDAIDPDTVDWGIENMSTGMAVAEPPGENWSGKHPSKLSGETSFNMVAKLSLKAHDDTSVYPAFSTACASDADRQTRTVKHRGGEKMHMTLKFTAQTLHYDQDIVLTLPLRQQEVDQLRQEYLDLTRKIPGRGEFKDADGDFHNFGKVFYDFGHYTIMMYSDLKGKHGDWTSSVNDIYRSAPGMDPFTRGDMFVTSAFRNPHHNDYHARELTSRATETLHGLHQYGLALDVRGSILTLTMTVSRETKIN